MTCPRCNGRTYRDYEGDVYCYLCGTLRAEPNPEALQDTLRGQPPKGAVRGHLSGLARPHEDQLAFPMPNRTVCVQCGEAFGFEGTRRQYCGDHCKQRAYKQRRAMVTA